MEKLQHGNSTDHNPRTLVLTAKDRIALEECYKDAFTNRGLPWGMVSAGGAYMGLNYGLFKPYKPLGFMSTIGLAGFTGCVAGLVSYKFICAQKVLASNTSWQQMIDQSNTDHRRPNVLPRSVDLSEALQAEPQTQKSSNLDMDTYQPSHDFDGFTGVNSDGDSSAHYTLLEPLDKYTGPPVTYDDLRRKNREDYANSQSAGWKPTDNTRFGEPTGNTRFGEPTGNTRFGEPTGNTRFGERTDNTRFGEPQTPISKPSYFGDRDRVPQYQLVD